MKKHVVQGEIRSLAELAHFAAGAAGYLRPGKVVGLSGPLGAGKTELVRAVLRSLGCRQQVVSPTFVLETIYDAPPQKNSGGFAVHHWDLYRLSGSTPPEDLLECAGDPASAVFIEWPERIAGVEDLLSVKIVLDFGALPGTVQQGGAEFRQYRISGGDAGTLARCAARQ